MDQGNKQWNQGFVISALIAVSLVLTILLAYANPVEQLKLDVTDQLFDIRGPIAIEDTSVVIVSISQQADQEIPYKYPWPTKLHAKLIENLNMAGAKVIGFDVLFDKRDNYDLSNDSLFARALNKYGNVVLGSNIDSRAQNRGGGSSSVSLMMVRPNNVLRNQNPNSSGLVRTYRDNDGSVRKYILGFEFNNRQMYSMGIELLKLYSGIDSSSIDRSQQYFQLGPFQIPKYNHNLMTINYFGGSGTFPTYSYETVIDDSTVILASEDSSFQMNTFSDPDFGLKHTNAFEDKIVLVGATMPSLHDLHATPFAQQGTMPGVEIHANALQTILSGRYIQQISWWGNLFFLLGLIIIVVIGTRLVNGAWGFVIYLLSALFVIGLVIFEFLQFNFILDLVAMLIALTVGYITTQSYDYVVSQREKRRIRGLFSSYVAPEVVREMIESGSEPELGGDEIYMTAFFSDIQSFSTFSEKLPAKTLVRLINEYLSAMTNILTDHGGTLDKYIGDAIVAFFGAPVAQKDHAYKACVVSQLMQQELGKLRAKWRAEGERWPDVVQHMRSRIGINTGTMVTGNMGSESRFNYTMMGDNVNLAARCESGAKQFGVYTMITEDTKNEAERWGDRCVFRYLDRIIVKGKSEPVNVYEVMGLRDQLSATYFNCKQRFEEAITAYQDRQWDRAIRLFEESAKLEQLQPNEESFIHTNPSLVYRDRCQQMKQNPPPADWNGVYVMESK